MRVPQPAMSFATQDAREQRWMLAHRWWSLNELRATCEAIIPAQLASLTEPLLAGSFPMVPLRIDVRVDCRRG